MAVQVQYRQVGGTRVPISAQLKRPNGDIVDLTGLAVKFTMVDTKGVVKVAETASNVTISDATNGKVYYSPQSDDVDTAGTYYAYFVVYGGSDYEHFPAKQGDLQIIIAEVG